jgi:hypothetical protein
MILFVLIFLSLYGAMNAYLFWKVWAAFPLPGKLALLLVGFLVLMVASPVLVHTLDRWRWFRLAGIAAAVGYSWMAIVFWACVLGGAADLWNVAVRGVGLVVPAAHGALLPARPALVVIGAVIVAAFCWGLAEAADIRVRNVAVDVPQLPAGTRELKLVQISDLHLGVHTGQRRLAKVVELIERVDPDILVSTGDLVDSSFQRVNSMSDLLARLRPRLGKYAVLGNHEFYAGLPESLAFCQATGFRVLRAESVQVAGAIRIAGVDDPAGRGSGGADLTDEDKALAADEGGEFVILLKHQPTVTVASRPRFDLQLSGHTHGGQIFPWHVITRLSYPFGSGLHRLAGGSQLYVSRGAGTWGPPVRLLAPPEITVFTLRPTGRAAGGPGADDGTSADPQRH